jgi:S1-C subfamily serine protease
MSDTPGDQVGGEAEPTALVSPTNDVSATEATPIGLPTVPTVMPQNPIDAEATPVSGFVTDPSSQGGGGYHPPPAGPEGPGAWQSNWADPRSSWAPPRPENPKSARVVRSAGVVLIAAALLIGAGIGIGHGLWHQSSFQTASSSPLGGSSPGASRPSFPRSGSGGTGSSGPSDVSAIATKVDPGLVDINTSLSYEDEQAAGTGMVLTSSGEVLTNNHVIDGATSISVTDLGNGQTYSASVVGYDRTQDVAVLQLHGASGLQTVQVGNSSNVSVGQSVVGIGNAGGTGGTPSATGGSVTALNQSITASDDGGGNAQQLSGLIESNADIQPGDSGGPLVNDSGQVIGMDTAASAGFQLSTNGGNSYSIPVNTALTIAKQIEAGQSSSTIHIGSTAFLGILVQPASSSGGFGGGFNQGGSQGSGAVVAQVLTGDPADQAGISAGDTITTLGGTTVDSPSALTAALGSYHPGDKVKIGWTDQSGQSHTATVSLTSGPPA